MKSDLELLKSEFEEQGVIWKPGHSYELGCEVKIQCYETGVDVATDAFVVGSGLHHLLVLGDRNAWKDPLIRSHCRLYTKRGQHAHTLLANYLSEGFNVIIPNIACEKRPLSSSHGRVYHNLANTTNIYLLYCLVERILGHHPQATVQIVAYGVGSGLAFTFMSGWDHHGRKRRNDPCRRGSSFRQCPSRLLGCVIFHPLRLKDYDPHGMCRPIHFIRGPVDDAQSIEWDRWQFILGSMMNQTYYPEATTNTILMRTKDSYLAAKHAIEALAQQLLPIGCIAAPVEERSGLLASSFHKHEDEDSSLWGGTFYSGGDGLDPLLQDPPPAPAPLKGVLTTYSRRRFNGAAQVSFEDTILTDKKDPRGGGGGLGYHQKRSGTKKFMFKARSMCLPLRPEHRHIWAL